MSHAEPIQTALIGTLGAALEAVPGMLRIIETLIIASEAEPRAMKPGPRSLLKIAERSAWVLRYMCRMRSRSFERGAPVQCLCDVGGQLLILCRRAGELQDERNSYIDEVLQLGIGNWDRARWWIGGARLGRGSICWRRGETLCKNEDVACPSEPRVRRGSGVLACSSYNLY